MKLFSKILLPALGLLMVSALAAQAADMQYISREEVKSAITSPGSDYLVLDLRKSADYEKGHMARALPADLAAAVDGDTAKGTATLKSVLTTATGSEKAQGKKIVLLCYSGAKYAQKGTDLLTDMGVDKNAIYTMKGGYKAWTADDPQGEYKKTMVSGKEPGEVK